MATFNQKTFSSFLGAKNNTIQSVVYDDINNFYYIALKRNVTTNNPLSDELNSFILKVNVDGSGVTTFNNNVNFFSKTSSTIADRKNYNIVKMEVLPNGNLLVFQNGYTQYKGTNISSCVILNKSNGSLVSSIGDFKNGSTIVYPTHVQRIDSYVYVCGTFNTFGSTSVTRIVALDTNGARYTGFSYDNTNLETVTHIEKQTVGGVTMLLMKIGNKILRMSTEGKVETSPFKPIVDGVGNGFGVDETGRIYTCFDRYSDIGVIDSNFNKNRSTKNGVNHFIKLINDKTIVMEYNILLTTLPNATHKVMVVNEYGYMGGVIQNSEPYKIQKLENTYNDTFVDSTSPFTSKYVFNTKNNSILFYGDFKRDETDAYNFSRHFYEITFEELDILYQPNYGSYYTTTPTTPVISYGTSTISDGKRIATQEWVYQNYSQYSKDNVTPTSTKRGITKSFLETNYDIIPYNNNNVSLATYTGFTTNRVLTRSFMTPFDFGVSSINYSDVGLNVDYYDNNYYLATTNYSNKYDVNTANGDINKLTSGTLFRIPKVNRYSAVSLTGTNNISKTNDITIMSTGKILINKDGYISLNNNSMTSQLRSWYDQKGYFMVSPNKKTAHVIVNGKSTILFDDSTTSGTIKALDYKTSGVVFNNGVICSDLKPSNIYYDQISGNKNRISSNIISVSNTVLTNHNAFLNLTTYENVSTNTNYGVLTLISEDYSLVKNGMYDNFIHDINKNSIQLNSKFTGGKTATSVVRSITPLNCSGKKLKFSVAYIPTQSDFLSNGLMIGSLTELRYRENTEFFVRLYSIDDNTYKSHNNYYEFKICPKPIKLTDNKTSYSDIWMDCEIDLSILNGLGNRTALDRYERLTLTSSSNSTIEGVNLYSGQINVSSIKKILFGVRTVGGETNRNQTAWFKDFRFINSDGSTYHEVDIRAESMKLNIYNVFPYIFDNGEGYTNAYVTDNNIWHSGNDTFCDIMTQKSIIASVDSTILKKIELVTRFTQTKWALIKVVYKDGSQFLVTSDKLTLTNINNKFASVSKIMSDSNSVNNIMTSVILDNNRMMVVDGDMNSSSNFYTTSKKYVINNVNHYGLSTIFDVNRESVSGHTIPSIPTKTITVGGLPYKITITTSVTSNTSLNDYVFYDDHSLISFNTNTNAVGGTWLNKKEFRVSGDSTIKISHGLSATITVQSDEDRWGYPIYDSETSTNIDLYINGIKNVKISQGGVTVNVKNNDVLSFGLTYTQPLFYNVTGFTYTNNATLKIESV